MKILLIFIYVKRIQPLHNFRVQTGFNLRSDIFIFRATYHEEKMRIAFFKESWRDAALKTSLTYCEAHLSLLTNWYFILTFLWYVGTTYNFMIWLHLMKNKNIHWIKNWKDKLPLSKTKIGFLMSHLQIQLSQLLNKLGFDRLCEVRMVSATFCYHFQDVLCMSFILI